MAENFKILDYTKDISETLPLGVFVFSDKLEILPKVINDQMVEKIYQRIVQEKQITGKPGESPYIHSLDSEFSKFYFMGTGKSDDFSMENFRLAGAALCRRLRKFNMTKVAIKFPELENFSDSQIQDMSQAFIEGFMLRNYDFSKYREKSHEGAIKELYIYEEDSKRKEIIQKGINFGFILSNATNLCRDIANEPANFMTPEIMARKAFDMSNSFNDKIKCTIHSKEDLEKHGMGCFLGVAKAGGEPPKMIVMEYLHGGKDAPVYALVGKGITFDSGGISLKNSSGMFHMKRDMSGAAAVIGTMKGLAELDLKINVVGIIGATENMPGSNAYKPGDVLKSMSGKTVEIINTDAEGRLVLADVLTYVQKNYSPNFIIDIATLTGAVQRALGGAMSGAFTNNKAFLSNFSVSTERANEPIWELPLAEKIYKGANKSYFADLKNSSDKPPGGTKAALFLYEFIENDTPWIHLDIAGTETASGEPSSYYPRGATGVGTRMFLEFFRNITKG